MNESTHLVSQPTPTLVHADGVWVVRLDRGNGKVQEYRCSTESQAQQLALVLAPREN